jgi:hypothetical protein
VANGVKKIDIDEEESEGNLQALESIVIRAQRVPNSSSANITDALLKFARIQMALSRRTHRQTRHVIILTWAIVLLTLGLLIFTVYLSYDAYLKDKRSDQRHESTSEQHDANN